VSPAAGRFPVRPSLVARFPCYSVFPDSLLEWRAFLEGAVRTASEGSEARVYRHVKREFPKEKERSYIGSRDRTGRYQTVTRATRGKAGWRAGSGGVAGEAGGLVGAQVGREDELGEVGQELAELGCFAGGDLAAGK
jgi:hypothetical protein